MATEPHEEEADQPPSGVDPHIHDFREGIRSGVEKLRKETNPEENRRLRDKMRAEQRLNEEPPHRHFGLFAVPLRERIATFRTAAKERRRRNREARTTDTFWTRNRGQLGTKPQERGKSSNRGEG